MYNIFHTSKFVSYCRYWYHLFKKEFPNCVSYSFHTASRSWRANPVTCVCELEQWRRARASTLLENASTAQPTSSFWFDCQWSNGWVCNDFYLLFPLRFILHFAIWRIHRIIAFRNVPQYRILVCGGDGTVAWVVTCLQDCLPYSACKAPPIAVLPVGTGMYDWYICLNWYLVLVLC